jgi:hypothetical protein
VILAALLLLSGDNVELEALRKVDQSDRHFVSSPQEINWERISKRDAARQQRVRELLLADEVHTARDFDNAALIMQHGNKPSDFLLAHELAAIAAYKGNFGSLPALAQDRWLDSIGRQQRWGSQSDWEGRKKPMPKTGAVVTDQMRRDLLLPTLAETEKYGMRASTQDIDEKIEYIQKRLDAREGPTQKELIRASVEAALQIVREEKLVTANDYAAAAKALLKSSKPDQLLLAHELSVIAMAWRSVEGPRLFAETLDRYLAAIDLPLRYSVGSVCPGVRRELRL